MSLGRTFRSLYERRIVAPRLTRRAAMASAARSGHRDRPGVLIMGWYGFETLGDRAILSSILQQIPAEARVFKATYDIKFSSATLQQIGAMHVECIGNNLRSFVGALADVGVVLIGGGPLMGSREMKAWAERLALARQVGCRTMVYGCGVGPLDSEVTRQAVGAVLEQADVITLRDEISVNNAVSVGVARERLTITADPALGTRFEPQRKVASVDSSLRIGISIRSFPRKCFRAFAGNGPVRSQEEISNGLFEAVASVAARLLTDHGAALFLVPMQTHPADDDRELLLKLRDRISVPNSVHVIEDAESPAAMLNHFANFDFLIGMRFHSVVFGLLTHTPLVAIDYDMHVGKMTGIMQAMGMADQVVGIGEVAGARLEEQVMRSIGQRDTLRERIAAALPRIQERESRNGNALRVLLKQATSE